MSPILHDHIRTEIAWRRRARPTRRERVVATLLGLLLAQPAMANGVFDVRH